MTGQTTPTPIRTDLPMAFPRNLVSTILVASLLMITMSKQGEAWVPPHTVISRGPLSTTGMSHRLTVSSTTLTSLMATADQQEKELRQKLSNRNTVTNGEERYAVADGAFLEKLNRPEATKSGSKEQINQVVDESSTSKLAVTVQRMIKPRAYPLFLTEKALEVVEAATSGLFRSADPLDDHDSTLRGGTKRERVVVLGTGWGAMSFLKEIDTSMYDVTVVSPRNHFVFTPMLAGASVGTVEFRSICEPIREINRQAQYLEAQATRIDPRTKTVECQSVVCDGNSCDIDDFTISYDRLVVTVGAQTNTFGIPGVRENCCFLKDVNDARRIRTAIVNCFERASLPHLTDEQRTRDLTFVVIGAGPTGVETSSEIRDFLQEDVPKYYPNLLKYVRIKVIEASSTVLAPFDKSLQEEAIRQLNREFRTRDRMAANLVPPGFRPCELMLQSSVKEIGEDRIILNDGTQIPYGVAIWAAGNGPIPLTLQLIDALGAEQQNEQSVARGRLAIDPWMRVIGSEGQILAFGDCSCITSGQLPPRLKWRRSRASTLQV